MTRWFKQGRRMIAVTDLPTWPVAKSADLGQFKGGRGLITCGGFA